MTAIDADRLGKLASNFSGPLLRPGSGEYEETRRVHNGLIDRRPALIARCTGTTDIVQALAFAREGGLEVSVRGGGHSVAGRSVTDGGVMIDLSLMKAIHVDPETRKVHAEGGVTWGEFNDATAAYGLATTGGVVSSTGIAGLTLGGGFGWLMGSFGLAVDNLLSVELVTAAGEVLTANAEEHPDLFWGLRGGGGNFGVATSLEYRLHPLGQIVGGLVAHPLPAAKEVLRFFREFTSDLSDELVLAAGLVHAPDGSGMPLAALIVCHAGSPEQAEADLKPLLQFGSPVMAQVGPMPYPAMNTLLDDGYPRGALNYWKSSFLAEPSDEVIDAMVDGFPDDPAPMGGVVLEHWHGAATRVGVSDTAVPHREPGFNFLVTSVWTDPATNDENIAWARATYAAVEPHLVHRRYVNYLDADDAGDTRGAYGPNYDRLAQVKRTYDPENVFHLNQNIEPAAS